MTQYPNWFAHYANDWFKRHLSEFVGKTDLRFLQIGAFTGDASLWLFENILTNPTDGLLVDVDTWEGSAEPEHEVFDWADIERTYDRKLTGRRCYKYKCTSAEFFAHAPVDYPELFDFIYIDGDHTAPSVLSDAIHAFDILKPGGLLAFDDYLWKPSDGSGDTNAPAVAIDTFALVYADRLELLESGLQVWFRKVAA